MKKHVLTALFAVILAASASAAAGGGPSLPPDVMRRIDTADGRRILSHLANDYFKGLGSAVHCRGAEIGGPATRERILLP
jgi:hypothetical protein